VVFSPDGKILASGSLWDGIKLWDVATAKPIAALETRHNTVWSVAFSPDGKTLAAGDWGETVYLWDVASRKKTATFEGHSGSVNAVAFSPDGRVLAAGSGVPFLFGPWTLGREKPGEIKLWQVASGKNIATVTEWGGQVHSLAFSPDGKMLLAEGKLRDVAHGRIIRDYVGRRLALHPGAFSPLGDILAMGEGDSIYLEDTPILDSKRGEKKD
jgi:WD40 repeat protein